MSGTLTTIATVANVLLGGASSMSLGGVVFQDFEVPETLKFGGKQMLAVHKFIGGARQIDAMGVDDIDISWTGILRGANTASRIQQLDAMRIVGQQVSLVWGQFQRTVVIEEFTVSYERQGFWCPYTITCVVVPTQSAPVQQSLLGQLASDLGVSDAFTSVVQTVAPAISAAQTALSSVQTVLPAVGVLTNGSAAFVSVSSAVTQAQGALGAASALGNTAVAAFVNPIQPGILNVPPGQPVQAIAAVNSAFSGSALLAGAQTAVGFINRMAANLANAST